MKLFMLLFYIFNHFKQYYCTVILCFIIKYNSTFVLAYSGKLNLILFLERLLHSLCHKLYKLVTSLLSKLSFKHVYGDFSVISNNPIIRPTLCMGFCRTWFVSAIKRHEHVCCPFNFNTVYNNIFPPVGRWSLNG